MINAIITGTGAFLNDSNNNRGNVSKSTTVNSQDQTEVAALTSSLPTECLSNNTVT